MYKSEFSFPAASMQVSMHFFSQVPETLWEYFVSYLVVMVVIRVGLAISSCGVLSLLGEVVASGFDSWVSYWSRCALS